MLDGSQYLQEKCNLLSYSNNLLNKVTCSLTSNILLSQLQALIETYDLTICKLLVKGKPAFKAFPQPSKKQKSRFA